jgi:hypothetical protein
MASSSCRVDAKGHEVGENRRPTAPPRNGRPTCTLHANLGTKPRVAPREAMPSSLIIHQLDAALAIASFQHVWLVVFRRNATQSDVHTLRHVALESRVALRQHTEDLLERMNAARR